MSENSLIVIGLMVWLLGYITNIFAPFGLGIKSVRLPNLAMFFLGKSRTKSSQFGVPFTVLGYQLTGLFVIIWGIAIKVFALEPALFSAIAIIFSLIVGYFLADWLYKRSPYVWKNEK